MSLAVELTSFTAEVGNCEITLIWNSESEVDNLGYIILRSLEKEGDYQEISSYQYNEDLKSAGNSSTRREYSYTDSYLTNGITYYYKLVDVDVHGIRTEHGPVSATPEEPHDFPTEFSLRLNYPNPFNPITTIAFDIPKPKGESGATIHTELKVFNIMGKEVKTLMNDNLKPGRYSVQWDGWNEFGEKVSSGVYIYMLKTPDNIKCMRMLNVK